MSAEASERAARSIENFSRSLTGLSKGELGKEVEYGTGLRAVQSMSKLNVKGPEEFFKKMFGESGDIAALYRDTVNAIENAKRSQEGIAGAWAMAAVGENENSFFAIRRRFVAQFEDEQAFMEAMARLRARFADLDTAAGFEAAISNVKAAETALGNFGDFIDGSFEGALESFQHEKAVQKPIAGALERLFTSAFENFASFDFATGDFAVRKDLTDLSQREINKLEEMFVNTRLEAAKNGAAKLIAGYRSLAEMETAERFQADIVKARSTLSTQFGEAGTDVYMQRSAIATFLKEIKHIRESATLARSRSLDTVKDSDAVVRVPDDDTGSVGGGS